MHAETISLVQGSFAKVAPIAPQAAALFYNNLFELNPNLKDLFKGDMTAQGAKLMQMIGAAVAKLHEPEVLLPILQHLAVRHKDYGVEDEHYATVGSALLKTLEQGLGAEFTPAVRDAWVQAYGVMSSTMITAAARA